MYRPTIYRNGLFDDLFRFSFPQTVQEGFDRIDRKGLMKTDIVEKDKTYELAIELPGYSKDQIEISLENGDLTVSAGCKEENQTEETGFIRKERFVGSVTRTFYVGDGMKEKDIHARLENGVLYIGIPKETEEEAETKKLIAID